MNKFKILILFGVSISVTSCLSNRDDPDAEYSKIVRKYDADFVEIKKQASLMKQRASSGPIEDIFVDIDVAGAQRLLASISETNDALRVFVRKYPNWEKIDEAKHRLKLSLESQEAQQKVVGYVGSFGKERRPSSKTKEKDWLTYPELDRMAHVGMKIGKNYRVVARHVSHGSTDALKPIEERDSNGIMITKFQMVSTSELTEEQRGTLYDLGQDAGCFSVALMDSGKLSLIDVKKGACE